MPMKKVTMEDKVKFDAVGRVNKMVRAHGLTVARMTVANFLTKSTVSNRSREPDNDPFTGN